MFVKVYYILDKKIDIVPVAFVREFRPSDKNDYVKAKLYQVFWLPSDERVDKWFEVVPDFNAADVHDSTYEAFIVELADTIEEASVSSKRFSVPTLPHSVLSTTHQSKPSSTSNKAAKVRSSNGLFDEVERLSSPFKRTPVKDPRSASTEAELLQQIAKNEELQAANQKLEQNNRRLEEQNKKLQEQNEKLEDENVKWRSLGFEHLEKLVSLVSSRSVGNPLEEITPDVPTLGNPAKKCPPVYSISKKLRKDGTEVDYIHLGSEVYVMKSKFDMVMTRPTDGKFVRDMAMIVCGSSMLLTHSVTGLSSNRSKGEPKPAIPTERLVVIRDRFRDFLSKKNSPDIESRLKMVNRHIAQKIQTLMRKQRPKKSKDKPVESANCEISSDEISDEEDETGRYILPEVVPPASEGGSKTGQEISDTPGPGRHVEQLCTSGADRLEPVKSDNARVTPPFQSEHSEQLHPFYQGLPYPPSSALPYPQGPSYSPGPSYPPGLSLWPGHFYQRHQ